MSAPIGIRALIAGDVDASTVGGSALHDLRGAPLRMVFISFDKPTHWLYAKPEIRTVKDLGRGRKVAIDGLGGNLGISAPVGIGKKRPRRGPRRAVSGHRDAAGPLPRADQWSGRRQPVYFSAQLQGQEAGFRELVNFVKQDIVSLTGSIVVREASDAGLVEKLVRGAVKGHLYARNNRSGTIPILARALKINEDVATKMYDAALPGMVGDGSINEEIQRRVIDDARRSLGMKESVSPDRSLDFRAVHKINADSKPRVGNRRRKRRP